MIHYMYVGISLAEQTGAQVVTLPADSRIMSPVELVKGELVLRAFIAKLMEGKDGAIVPVADDCNASERLKERDHIIKGFEVGATVDNPDSMQYLGTVEGISYFMTR